MRDRISPHPIWTIDEYARASHSHVSAILWRHGSPFDLFLGHPYESGYRGTIRVPPCG